MYSHKYLCIKINSGLIHVIYFSWMFLAHHAIHKCNGWALSQHRHWSAFYVLYRASIFGFKYMHLQNVNSSPYCWHTLHVWSLPRWSAHKRVVHMHVHMYRQCCCCSAAAFLHWDCLSFNPFIFYSKSLVLLNEELLSTKTIVGFSFEM